MSKLVVLGSVNADHVLQVNSFPQPGETLQGSSYQVVAGGKGANQAVAAARLGADIAFIACIGDDAFGQQSRINFAKDGINTEAVMEISLCPTGIAMILVAATGENSIAISAEANAQLTPQRLAAHTSLIEQADTLLMQLESPIETVTAAAQLAKQHQTRVVLNPAPARALDDDLLALIDMITPNETEAEALTGIKVVNASSAAQAAQVLHLKGIPWVLITMGSQGAWVSHRGEGRLVAGYKVKALDTTAAGDTFNGALVTALLEQQPAESAIRFAHAAAALSVTKFGAQPSIPDRQQVFEFIAQQDSATIVN
ncbi:ribokinase [Agarivorans sp. Z349TD_8]|uniref:ribokinase n=1 Tax=Agarivorans sp. Z349TD_8 TaxID=3421434 RepID=UPI003D7EFD3F